MITITNKKDCCGCGACAQSCIKNCITMRPDEEGFLYPSVDAQSCIGCGACERVCPILRDAQIAHSGVTAYAAYAADDGIRGASSSGGIFTLLAQWALGQGGAVFGAAFAEDLSVHHIKVERMEDLPRLRGSKYVQSRVEDTFREAKAALDAGQTVLFSGVGCQIAGLKAYLGKEYEKLYTVDVLCHGVPSPKVWETYLREREAQSGGQTVEASFRSKALGWKRFSMELSFDNGERCRETLDQDPYMRCFLSNICLRPSCHSCRFKTLPRLSDLTIGDAWGIGRHMPQMDDDRGTSVVLVNTEKGKDLWDRIAPQTLFRRGETDVLLPPGADSRKSVRSHPNRNRFFKELDRGADMARLVSLTKKSLPRRILSWGKRSLKGLINKKA